MNNPDFNNYIQVAGVFDQQEANMLVESGVQYLGFPLRLPVNKPDLTEIEACKIIANLNPPNYGVVISYSSTANEAIKLCNTLGCKIIQLHGPITITELKQIKYLQPELTIIKSLVIRKDNEKQLTILMKVLEPYVDAFITDTFDPSTGASGATGKTHDWSISRRLVELSKKPVILAGGINANNVYDAIVEVKPAGVDVHTGVENNTGRKDKPLIIKFMKEAKRAFNYLGLK